MSGQTHFDSSLQRIQGNLKSQGNQVHLSGYSLAKENASSEGIAARQGCDIICPGSEAKNQCLPGFEPGTNRCIASCYFAICYSTTELKALDIFEFVKACIQPLYNGRAPTASQADFAPWSSIVVWVEISLACFALIISKQLPRTALKRLSC